MKKVVVTLTTLPDRLVGSVPEGIKSCIHSLVNQNYENYEVHFNIPDVNKFTNVPYVIPKWLMDLGDDKLKIYRTKDLGPPTKLIPTVERIKDDDTIIITVDDDLVYHQDMVVEQISNQTKWPESCVGYDGLRSRDLSGNFSNYFGDVRDYYYTSNYRNTLVDILQHYKTVSYKRSYFENDFFDFVNKYYSWSDDLLISAYFSSKRRDRIVTYHPSDTQFQVKEEWDVGGGVLTFPILRHTHYEFGGCGTLRGEGVDDNSETLYSFVNEGYVLRNYLKD